MTHKAQVVGYHPELMLVARRINDSMGDMWRARSSASCTNTTSMWWDRASS